MEDLVRLPVRTRVLAGLAGAPFLGIGVFSIYWRSNDVGCAVALAGCVVLFVMALTGLPIISMGSERFRVLLLARSAEARSQGNPTVADALERAAVAGAGGRASVNPALGPETLRDYVRTQVAQRIEDGIHYWAPLTAQEIRILVDWIFTAIDNPALEPTYPVYGDEDDALMQLHSEWSATRVQSDGKRVTLERIRDAHRTILAEVRTWEVVRRLRPGPIPSVVRQS
jgi:hypothetical protein